jgi:L-lactate dehydrogenase
MPVDEYAKLIGVELNDEQKAEIADKTRLSGAEIIKLKRATFNCIAVSATTLAESILNNEHTVRTVCTKLDGQYGKKDIAMNVPCVLGGSGVEKILELPLNATEMDLFNKSEANIRAAIESVKDL